MTQWTSADVATPGVAAAWREWRRVDDASTDGPGPTRGATESPAATVAAAVVAEIVAVVGATRAAMRCWRPMWRAAGPMDATRVGATALGKTGSANGARRLLAGGDEVAEQYAKAEGAGRRCHCDIRNISYS